MIQTVFLNEEAAVRMCLSAREMKQTRNRELLSIVMCGISSDTIFRQLLSNKTVGSVHISDLYDS